MNLIEPFIFCPIADDVNVKNNCNKHNIKKPGVFTFVGRFKKWIKKQIEDRPVKVIYVRDTSNNASTSQFSVGFMTLSVMCFIYVK